VSQLSRGERVGRSLASLEKGWKGEGHVLCLGWDRPGEEGRGHKTPARCPALGRDLLWLELTRTREIVNGDELLVRAPPKAEQRVSPGRGTGCSACSCCHPGKLPAEGLEPQDSARTRRRDGGGRSGPFSVAILPRIVSVAPGLPRDLQGLHKNRLSRVTEPRPCSSLLSCPCSGWQIPLRVAQQARGTPRQTSPASFREERGCGACPSLRPGAARLRRCRSARLGMEGEPCFSPHVRPPPPPPHACSWPGG